jgi:hypothetical protein
MKAPALIRGLPSAEYHVIKAMSASMAVSLVEECPLKAWIGSAFNPDLVIERKPVFDIGTALHLAVLEPDAFESRTVLHDFAEYRTNESRAIRDSAYEAGKTPLKPVEGALVAELRDSIMDAPEIARLLKQPGDAEVSLTWEWNGLPCKARPDYLPDDCSFVLDLKTANTAEPRAMGRKALTEGWHIRAPWYMAGVKAVKGILPEHYWFAVVEKDAPYISQLYEMEDRALVRGEQLIERALDLFNECRIRGVWPKYREGSSIISLPGWAEFQYADREAAGEI